jgi:predicted RNase H-like HicB family nuclease
MVSRTAHAGDQTMELSVLVKPVEGNGYRAWCPDPIAVSVEGATREEALDKLRDAIEHQLRGGVEVVRLRVTGGIPRSGGPVCPDDEITRTWLAGIEAAREEADARRDPWDEPPRTA